MLPYLKTSRSKNDPQETKLNS